MSKWIAEFELEDGDTMPEHMDLEYQGVKLDFYCKPEKIGYWIDTGSGQMCSRCGEIQHGYDSFRRFCASCGAKMREVEK